MSAEGGPRLLWAPIAAAGILHLALLGWIVVEVVDLGRTPLRLWLPVALALAALAVTESGLALALHALLRRLDEPLGRRGAACLDAVQGVALAVAVALPFASYLKMRLTGAHLRGSDLWFLAANAGQLLGESTARERLTLLTAPVLTILLAVAFGLAFRAARARRSRLPRGATAAIGAAAAVLVALWTLVPASRRFAADFVPEVHWLARRIERSAAPTPWTAAGDARAITPWTPIADGPRPNVVLVMLESVSWPRVLARPSATPRLIQLAGESVVFERPYAVATHSDYAQMAVLSALHPRKFAHHDFYADLAYPRTLIWDALSPAGYSTALFSTQNEAWGNMIRYLDTPGLDVLRHAPDWPRARRRGFGAESKVFAETPVTELFRWLTARRRQPFLAYLNFQATHFPYEVPDDAERPFRPDDLPVDATFVRYPRSAVARMTNRYYNSLRYVDHWVGRTIDGLVDLGLWESTILVVVADHGEAFYEHDLPTHGTGLHEEQVRSLWLLRAPGVEPRTIRAPVSLLDVAPTVLRLLGQPPHGNFQGRDDLLEADYGSVGRPFLFTIQGLVEQDAVIEDDWKLIVDHDRRTATLFDLASDPGETHDLFAERPERAAALERRLRELLATQLAYYRDREWERGAYPPALP